MYEIKLIDKDTDLSKVNKHALKWDVVVNNIPQEVYRIEGFIHSIGGHFGENDYWCCPRDQEPSVDNLIEFSGHVIQWGIEYIPINYTKYKWGEDEVRKTGRTVIKRNGKTFYVIGCNNMDYGLAKARYSLTRLEEHPIGFSSYDFVEKDVIGRKIWYSDQPAIIQRANWFDDNGFEVWIVPDKNFISKFRFPRWEGTEEESWISEYENGLMADILESPIDWFRENK